MTIHEYETAAANYTGGAHRAPNNYESSLFLLAEGNFGASGTVAVELADPDGAYRSFPETVLNSDGTRRITMPPGQVWRLVVANCTSVNVEVRS